MKSFPLVLVLIAGCVAVGAQTPGEKPTPAPTPTPSLERRFLKNVLDDQAHIWTLPVHLKGNDAAWIAPLGLFTGVFIATDKETAGALGDNSTRIRISRRISTFGSLYTTSGIAAAFYITGRQISDPRVRETGLLAFEATLDGVIVSEVLKAVTQRPRPQEKNGSGRFFQGGRSFPSGHAINSWALASILAHEYGDSRTMQILSYGVASAVSISRFTAREHFLSDILVGSAIGYGIGTYVYHKRHDARNPPGTRSDSQTGWTIVPHYNREAKFIGARVIWRF